VGGKQKGNVKAEREVERIPQARDGSVRNECRDECLWGRINWRGCCLDDDLFSLSH
jgi:hypothetical protein